MTDTLSVVKEKIQRYLGELVGTYEVGPDYYRVRHQSTAVIIRSFLWQEKHAMVHLSAILLREVEPKEGFWAKLAALNKEYMFGKPCYYADQKLLTWEYYLLGDYMDKEELNKSITLVVLTADELDDKLQALFGGKKFVDN